MEVLIDVAVKHPCTEQLLPHTAAKDGHAACIAEREKRREYMLPGGKALTPFGVETFGRLGAAAEELLRKMQAVAANRSRLRGGHASRIVERLRERIDAHLHRHAVHMCTFAEHGLGGTALYRKVPMSADGVMAGIMPAMLRDTPELEPVHCSQPRTCQHVAVVRRHRSDEAGGHGPNGVKRSGSKRSCGAALRSR